ncbi:MAG: hypothetical protein R3268_01570 [Acidiferrobacterales bacterium]|nr:hypothetical protein [Acidiferrobacterales bacterium]
MTFHAQFKSDFPLDKISKDLDRRFHNAKRAIGRKLAQEVTKEVLKRVPPGAGWLDIYRKAITYRESEDGMQWAVFGMSEIKLQDPPAETSLLAFQGNDEFTAILSPYNPWPVDLIPPIAGGYKGNAVVRNVAASEVEAARDRLNPLRGVIEKALSDAGATVMPPEFLVEILGKVYADIAYMAKRMELGYDGFPRIPHWGPAASKLNTMAERWAGQSESTEEVHSAFRGANLPSVSTMSQAEARSLARIRDASWP